jgi:hypothetical protein
VIQELHFIIYVEIAHGETIPLSLLSPAPSWKL